MLHTVHCAALVWKPYCLAELPACASYDGHAPHNLFSIPAHIPCQRVPDHTTVITLCQQLQGDSCRLGSKSETQRGMLLSIRTDLASDCCTAKSQRHSAVHTTDSWLRPSLVLPDSCSNRRIHGRPGHTLLAALGAIIITQSRPTASEITRLKVDNSPAGSLLLGPICSSSARRWSDTEYMLCSCVISKPPNSSDCPGITIVLETAQSHKVSQHEIAHCRNYVLTSSDTGRVPIPLL